MQAIEIIGLMLIIAVMIRELSYFTPHRMIYTYKGTVEWLVFAGGILVLILLTVKLASAWFHVCFGVMGIIAFSAMWLKQGVSSNGVLTIARGQELYQWADIGSVKIEVGEIIQVYWFKENGNLIMKQKYAKKNLEALKATVSSNKIENHS